MTFEEIIGREEFTPTTAAVLLAAMAKSVVAVGQELSVAKVLPRQMELVSEHFHLSDPIQAEACRALARSLADQLDSLSLES